MAFTEVQWPDFFIWIASLDPRAQSIIEKKHLENWDDIQMWDTNEVVSGNHRIVCIIRLRCFGKNTINQRSQELLDQLSSEVTCM